MGRDRIGSKHYLGSNADAAIEHADGEILSIISPAAASNSAGDFSLGNGLSFW